MKYALKPSTARKIKRLFAGDMSSGRRAVDDVIIEHSDLPTLYTVVYSAALESWLIYLADDALNVNGAAVDVIGDLEEAGDPYPDGYYILSALDPESGGTVYLNISSGEAEFSDEADESADYSIKVATATVDDETGRRTVSQLITSAIVIGGGEGIPVTGTDDVQRVAKSIVFSSELDSNVTIVFSEPDEDGNVVASVGVYYV